MAKESTQAINMRKSVSQSIKISEFNDNPLYSMEVKQIWMYVWIKSGIKIQVTKLKLE